MQTVTVSAVTDDILESTESFTLSLSSTDTMIILEDPATVSIEDDTGQCLYFSHMFTVCGCGDMLSIKILLISPSGSAQAQCWTSSGCTGDTVPADDARDCCIGTEDGQSYGGGPGDCAVSQVSLYNVAGNIFSLII